MPNINASTIQTIVTSISSIFVALIANGYLKKYLDRKKETNSKSKLIKQLKTDEVIYYSLRELKMEYNSDRIYIIQFHNGGNFYNGTSIQKMSVTYERCADGLETLADKFNNIIVSNYSWYINNVLENKMYYTDIDDIEDLFTRGFIRSMGTHSGAAVPIFKTTNQLSGILVIEWASSEIPSEILLNNQFNDDFKKNFLKQAGSIMNQI